MRKTLFIGAFIIILSCVSVAPAFAEASDIVDDTYATLEDYYVTVDEQGNDREWRVNPTIEHYYVFHSWKFAMFDSDLSAFAGDNTANCYLFCYRVEWRDPDVSQSWHATNLYAYHLKVTFSVTENWLVYCNVREFDSEYMLNLLPLSVSRDVINGLVSSPVNPDNFYLKDGIYCSSPFNELFMDDPNWNAHFFDCQIHFANRVDYDDLLQEYKRESGLALCTIDTYFNTAFLDFNESDNMVLQDFPHSLCYAMTGCNPYGSSTRENNIDWLYRLAQSGQTEIVLNALSAVLDSCVSRFYPVLVRQGFDGSIYIYPDSSVSNQILSFCLTGSQTLRSFTEIYEYLRDDIVFHFGNLTVKPFEILFTLFYYGCALLVPLGMFKGVYYG